MKEYTCGDVKIPYEIIKSSRKSVSFSFTDQADLLIKAPRFMSDRQITALLWGRQDWLLENYRKFSAIAKQNSRYTDTQKTFLEKKYRQIAKRYIPERVAYFQPFTGGSYNTIAIREQKTRWGSCSSNGTLSFHWRLMMAPPHVLDYVVVHELCHLTHMNHSKAFWGLVEQVMPDYKRYQNWLKEHGSELAAAYAPIPWDGSGSCSL